MPFAIACSMGEPAFFKMHVSYNPIFFVGEIHFTSGVEAVIFDPGATFFFGRASMEPSVSHGQYIP